MEVQELIAQIEKLGIIALDGVALPELLEKVEAVRADDTCVAGWIRILRINDYFTVQEQTPGGDVLVRRMVSREAAERFVEDRLNDYERMWDGCGCKIDYNA
ncbi:MAG: hypothetical protein QNL88_10335 [Acidobacteriota bacterium]|nr:hypothetical protein [Acidobacteriota bacterium]